MRRVIHTLSYLPAAQGASPVVTSSLVKIYLYRLCVGDLLHVNWEAGHWNHNGQFPIHWLQENNYCEEKSKPKKRVVAVSKLYHGVLVQHTF